MNNFSIYSNTICATFRTRIVIFNVQIYKRQLIRPGEIKKKMRQWKTRTRASLYANKQFITYTLHACAQIIVLRLQIFIESRDQASEAAD